MEGYLYVMTNHCFKVENCHKLGFTTDIEQRKRSYTTSYPEGCEWPYISERVTNIRTRERLLFQRLKDFRFNDSREFFICPIETIKSTIDSVLKLTLKEMNLELNVKEWKNEITLFLKKVLKKTTKAKYNKVLVDDLYRTFCVWCMAKNIKKNVNRKEFEESIETKYTVKNTKLHPKKYLEKIEFKI